MDLFNGIIVKKHNLNSLFKVSDLIYYDGPILSHYSNSNGDHYLFYWVDSDDQFNRWLVYRVSFDQLNCYVDKKITLRTLFLESSDEYVHCTEVDEDVNYNNVRILNKSDIPDNYLPQENSFYTFNHVTSDGLFEALLSKSSSGIFQAAFKNSSKVGYGKIHLEVLSPVLYHMNEMSDGLSVTYFNYKRDHLKKDPRTKRKPKISKKEVKSNTLFEVAGMLPGSFKLLLKPVNTQAVIPGEKTEVDLYCEYFLHFIQASFDYNTLKEFASIEINQKVFVHYEKLLNNIRNFNLEMDFKWSNKLSNTKIERKINSKIASKIIDNLNKLEYENDTEIELKGKFLEVNLKTNHYTFVGFDEDETESRGYFHDLIKDGAYYIKFDKEYDVKINRRESKETGNKNPKNADVMISCIEIK